MAIIGGGFTGLWTAIALTDTDPSAARRRPRGGDGRVRRERAQRRVLRGEPDPRPGQRDPALPRRARAARARGHRQPPGAHRVHPRARHRLRPRGDRAPSPSPTSPTRSTSSGRGSTRPPSTASTSSSSTARRPGPRSTRRCGTPGCTGRRGATSSSIPRSCAGASPAWRASAASPSTSARASPGSSGAPAASLVTTADGATVRADHVVVATSAYSGWLRRLSPLFVPVYDYVLVSEPLAAGPASGDRLGAPPGPVRREQPVPLLPADRRRPRSCGAATTPSTTSAAGWIRSSTSVRRRSTSSRRSSSGRSRSSTGCASRTAGAARSTRRRGSRSRSGRRWAAG